MTFLHVTYVLSTLATRGQAVLCTNRRVLVDISISSGVECDKSLKQAHKEERVVDSLWV
jgi:hypothetical protein